MLPHLYIYAPKLTGRFQWLVHVFFTQWFCIPIELVSAAKAIPEDAIVLSYGDSPGLEGEIHISAHEQGCVLNQNILSEAPMKQSAEGIELFPVRTGDLPVDIFSAAAFCLGRMEEYGTDASDEHQRFPGRASHAGRKGYLHRAVIDRYFNALVDQCLQRCPEWGQQLVQMKDYHPTMDVDSIWAFRHKGLYREIGSFVKNAIRGDWDHFRRRMDTVLGRGKDPFDTFDRLALLHEQHGLDPSFFILTSRTGRFDVQNSLHSKAFRQRVRALASRYDIGLHPGYSACDRSGELMRQKKFLEQLCARPVHSNRFHYLRFRIPDSYRILNEAGFKSDFSLGYADRIGFRAGSSRPFAWYDFEEEKMTGLVLYPFQVMDTTLNKYMNSSPGEAIRLMKNLYIECRNVGGTFRTLWHNSSLSELGEWKNWSDVYARWLDLYEQSKPVDKQ